MSKYISPFNLPDEHMRLVGIISAHWEFVDTFLQQAIAFVSEHEFQRVALLTDNLGFRTKIDFLMAYARPLQNDDPKLWKEFTTNFSAINAPTPCEINMFTQDGTLSRDVATH